MQWDKGYKYERNDRTTTFKIFKAIYRPILTYRYETCVLSRRKESKIGTVE